MLIGRFLLAYSAPNITADQALAKAEFFMDAVTEFPSWCIAETIRRWNRKQISGEVNYAFPIPGDFRIACEDVKKSTEGRLHVYDRILLLNTREKHSEEYLKTMSAKVTPLVRSAIRT